MYDEGHITTRPAAVADEWTRTAAWFDFWLRGMLYPDPSRAYGYNAWKQKIKR
jgi:hypothetical protein